MPDTPANRKEYPYPNGQQVGCGFPMVRLGGLIDLSHGYVNVEVPKGRLEHIDTKSHG